MKVSTSPAIVFRAFALLAAQSACANGGGSEGQTTSANMSSTGESATTGSESGASAGTTSGTGSTSGPSGSATGGGFGGTNHSGTSSGFGPSGGTWATGSTFGSGSPSATSGSGGAGTGTSSGYVATTGTGATSSGSVPAGGSGTYASSGSNPPACGATVTPDAMPLNQNYLSMGPCSTGYGGYGYSYEDTAGSTACMPLTALCARGTTAIQTPANSMTAWGAGLGVNLNQVVGAMTLGTCAATGSAVAYAISGSLPPQGMRIIIDNNGKDYCAPLSTTSGSIPWSHFNTACWQPSSGTSLSGPPTNATHLEMQVDASSSAGVFDFCITSLKFM